jgi:hypothetical protein
MTPDPALRDRYLRDEPSIRLGGLAANLARIESFSRDVDNQEVVARLLEESAFFIEWTAADVSDDVRIALAELQRALVQWRRSWDRITADSDELARAADEVGRWSQRILRLAGLLPG